MDKWILLSAVLGLALFLSACTRAGEATVSEETSAAQPEGSQAEPAEASGDDLAPEPYVFSDEATDLVDILMDSGQHIVIQLDPKAAPKTVENFKKLVGEGIYNGLGFHRVIDGFMIQGGDPEGTGMGGTKETIPGEFKANGFENPLKHVRGVISMARTMDPNSASSQFFICNADVPHLDGQYAAFGQVLSGMDEVDRIAKLPKDRNDRPNVFPVMKKVRFLRAK